MLWAYAHVEVKLYVQVRKRFWFTRNVGSFLQKENLALSNKFAFYNCFEIWKWVGKNSGKIVKKAFFAVARVKIFFTTRHSGNKTISFLALSFGMCIRNMLSYCDTLLILWQNFTHIIKGLMPQLLFYNLQGLTNNSLEQRIGTI